MASRAASIRCPRAQACRHGGPGCTKCSLSCKANPCRAQERSELALADLDRLATKILSVEFDQVNNDETSPLMVKIAENCERLAQRAEQRAKNRSKSLRRERRRAAPSPAPIHRMARVQRPPIQADIGAEAPCVSTNRFVES
jgi:hypothetical protein